MYSNGPRLQTYLAEVNITGSLWNIIFVRSFWNCKQGTNFSTDPWFGKSESS